MSTSLSPPLAAMLSSPAMRAVCDDVACLQHMLELEAARARADAATGVIPAAAAGPIGRACKAGSVDLAALAEAATRSGNLAIPLVKALTGDASVTVHLSSDRIAADGLSGRLAGPDRSPARFTRRQAKRLKQET